MGIPVAKLSTMPGGERGKGERGEEGIHSCGCSVKVRDRELGRGNYDAFLWGSLAQSKLVRRGEGGFQILPVVAPVCSSVAPVCS